MVFSPARGVVLVDGRSTVVNVVDGAGEGLIATGVVVVDVPESGLPAAAMCAWLALTLLLSFCINMNRAAYWSIQKIFSSTSFACGS